MIKLPWFDAECINSKREEIASLIGIARTLQTRTFGRSTILKENTIKS